MMRRNGILATAAGAAVLALAPATGLAPAADIESAAQAPRSGARYGGMTEEDKRISLRTSRTAIEIVAFRFDCVEAASGATSLQAIRLRRRDDGYSFKISARGIVSFSDEAPDENAAIAIRGRFSRSAKTVSGVLRVDAPRCDTGYVSWRATRRRG
ncbi:MAG: hypothetical protein M3340_16895 [Actinomycetota bacterium]|nr:hypothetical protein [Actinomycetota bacterium]